MLVIGLHSRGQFLGAWTALAAFGVGEVFGIVLGVCKNREDDWLRGGTERMMAERGNREDDG